MTDLKASPGEERVVDGFHVVIPARYESTRLPGKPLADIAGVPMIVRVARAAAASGAIDVTVATDDERIVEVVIAAGFKAQLTSSSHRSGSDRVFEVVQAQGWAPTELVLNVQGDEPLLPPALVAQVGEHLATTPEINVCTLREPITKEADKLDPNCVKVVVDNSDRALLFSRAAIPHTVAGYDRVAQKAPWGWRHVGLYGYRISALQAFVSLAPSPLELQESLEQLRLLENGISLTVLESCEPAAGGVDTPEDLARVRAEFATS